MSQQRLDQLIAALADTRPALDDVTRARLGASIEARAAAAPSRSAPLHRRWLAAGAAAAAALAAGVVWHGRATVAMAPPPPPAAVRPAPAAPPDAGVLFAAPGESTRGELAGAAITLYGRGWARQRAGTVVAEASSLVIDRAGRAGEEPLQLEISGVTIRVQSARFSVNSTQEIAVSVERGEIWLSCTASEPARQLLAAQSTTCRIHASDARPSPPAAPDRAAEAPSAPPAAITAVPAPGPTPANRPAAPHRAAAPAAVTPAPAPADASAPEPPAPSADAGPPRIETSPAPRGEPLPEPAPASTGARYATAERLMTTDPEAARAALSALVAEAPRAPEAAAALLDIATLALRAGDAVGARAALDRLAGHPLGAVFARQAAYLRCVAEPDRGRQVTCLTRFRAEYPDSPNDADVLARLAYALVSAGKCRAALPLLAEYRRRYPQGTWAATLHAMRDQCAADTP